MAEFGAMILMDNGNPFVTPQSTPFCLYGKGHGLDISGEIPRLDKISCTTLLIS